jgi:hypothetical protein
MIHKMLRCQAVQSSKVLQRAAAINQLKDALHAGTAVVFADPNAGCCWCFCCCCTQGPLAPLAAAIQSAVVQAGQALQGLGVKSFGACVLEHLDGLKQAG